MTIYNFGLEEKVLAITARLILFRTNTINKYLVSSNLEMIQISTSYISAHSKLFKS